MTWPSVSNKMAAVLWEASALPPCTLCDDMLLCLRMIIGVNSADFASTASFITPFVVCFSTGTRKEVTNHRGQSQNKQSALERTCPTCGSISQQNSAKSNNKPLVVMVSDLGQ